MSSKISTLCFVILLILSSAVPSLAKYSGGTGEPNNPYLIGTPEDLNSIGLDANDWDKHFKMIADINMADINSNLFNMIGYWQVYDDPCNEPFCGVFDGNGHTISNFTYSLNKAEAIGLFMYVSDPNAKIKNLGLIDPNINVFSGYFVGSLVGVLEDGTITDCNVENGSVSGGYNAGGLFDVGVLVGWNVNGKISDCRAAGIVQGYRQIGGLVGWNENGIISRCYTEVYVDGHFDVGGLVGDNGHGEIYESSSRGAVNGNGVGGLVGFVGSYYGTGVISNCHSSSDVTGGYSDTGGLVGECYRGVITNCWSSGNVKGNNCVGGLIGSSSGVSDEVVISNCYSLGNVTGTGQDIGGLIGTSDGTITNCYSASSVSGDDYVGGFAGYDISGLYTKCFWDIEINPNIIGIGNNIDPNVIGLLTAEMKMRSTFADAGWDMLNVWDIGENQTYPFLRTHLPSDINKDDETNFYDFVILAENWLKEE